MISNEFVEQLYSTSTIQRWTDHVRPLDLTALGKHAHMVTMAWVIGRQAEAEPNDRWKIDWDYLIRGSLYELLRISVLTDIKSPVLEEIRSNQDLWKKVNDDVIKRLKEKLGSSSEWILEDIEDYFEENHSSAERWNAYLVLKAASALATSWEFQLISNSNPFIHDLDETNQNVNKSVRSFQYIPSVLDIYENRNDLHRFTNLCGRLRFQLRWSQTPILPSRPVLDHELIVAYLTYGAIAKEDVKIGGQKMWERYQAFFGSLFHDLPEVLTRDVISPIKDFGGGVIGKIVGDVERDWFEKTFKPMLPKRLYYELRFFAIDEFAVKEWPPKDWPAYLQHLDQGRDGAKFFGPIIRACDKFAGFMEAYYSFTFGVTSPSLKEAIYPDQKMQKARDNMNKNDYDFSQQYEYFTNNVKTKEATLS